MATSHSSNGISTMVQAVEQPLHEGAESIILLVGPPVACWQGGVVRGTVRMCLRMLAGRRMQVGPEQGVVRVQEALPHVAQRPLLAPYVLLTYSLQYLWQPAHVCLQARSPLRISCLMLVRAEPCTILHASMHTWGPMAAASCIS